MRESARKTAEEYDWQKVAQRYVSVYEEARQKAIQSGRKD
jgi:glycosyltransferase involved in cell wall biosynthesis